MFIKRLIMTNEYLDELISVYKKTPKKYPMEYGDWAEPYSEQLAKVYNEGEIVNKPVSDKAIKEAEARLNVKLPPSYVEFLKYSNGLLLPDKFTNLLPIENIDWFYKLNKEWVDIWQEGAEGYEETSDEEYFVYGKEQDSCKIRERYLKTALQISDTLEGDVLLLNPKVKFGEEWEAWWFGNKLPGAIRFKSFGELLEYLLTPEEESEPMSEEEYQKMLKESQKAFEKAKTEALDSVISSMLSNGLGSQDILNEFQKEFNNIKEENRELFERVEEKLDDKDSIKDEELDWMKKVNDIISQKK